MILRNALRLALLSLALGAWAQSDQEFAEQREAMVSEQIASRGIENPAVLDAMRSVPRHEFMPADQRAAAYGDHPLPIGHGQTISQPYIVAYMTEMMDLASGETVLEVGTGSGYQAAILAEITDNVFTVEIIPALAESARETLDRLGYTAVQSRQSDGYYGWEEHAPFDAILVTAAANSIPPPLVQQLAPGGRMLVPVGATPWTQNLVLVTRDESGQARTRTLIPVRFVPLTGEGH